MEDGSVYDVRMETWTYYDAQTEITFVDGSRVAQDPVRHRMEPVADGYGEAREGLLVAMLRPDHHLGIHGPFRWNAGRPTLLYGMSPDHAEATHFSCG
jgi:hypothetical protein